MARAWFSTYSLHPVAHALTLTINRQRLAVAHVVDEQWYQFFQLSFIISDSSFAYQGYAKLKLVIYFDYNDFLIYSPFHQYISKTLLFFLEFQLTTSS